MNQLKESRQKRKSDQQILSRNEKRNRLNEDVRAILTILKSWIIIAEDGSFTPTSRYIEAVDMVFNELYPTDSQKVFEIDLLFYCNNLI